MTRYGLLADIHGNLEALRAAVSRLTQEGAERWLCSGDLVDYGPNPNECITELQRLNAICVAGNHDLIAAGLLPSTRYGPRAREALAWTQTQLTDASHDYLAGLPRTAAIDEIVLAHGSLTDPEQYINTRQLAAGQLEELATRTPQARLLVLGHTHHTGYYSAAEPLEFPHGRPSAHPTQRLHQGRCLINPGAIGQSRDREPRPRARFALLDLPSDRPGEIRFFALPYDDTATRAKLRAAGLPDEWIHLRPGKAAKLARRTRAIARRIRHSGTRAAAASAPVRRATDRC